jgi:hypothetical protein
VPQSKKISFPHMRRAVIVLPCLGGHRIRGEQR